MTAKELLNLIDWLRKQGFEDDRTVLGPGRNPWLQGYEA